MKATRTLVILLVMLCSVGVQAQVETTQDQKEVKQKKAKKKKVKAPVPYYDQKVTKKNVKQLEPDALKAAEFLLNNPSKPVTQERVDIMAFMAKWMTRATDYDFDVGKFYEVTVRNSPELDELYRAAIVKVFLTDPTLSGDGMKTDLAVGRILVEYCKDRSNKVYGSSAIKKLIKADKKDELEKAIMAIRK